LSFKEKSDREKKAQGKAGFSSRKLASSMAMVTMASWLPRALVATQRLPLVRYALKKLEF